MDFSNGHSIQQRKGDLPNPTEVLFAEIVFRKSLMKIFRPLQPPDFNLLSYLHEKGLLGYIAQITGGQLAFGDAYPR